MFLNEDKKNISSLGSFHWDHSQFSKKSGAFFAEYFEVIPPDIIYMRETKEFI